MVTPGLKGRCAMKMKVTLILLAAIVDGSSNMALADMSVRDLKYFAAVNGIRFQQCWVDQNCRVPLPRPRPMSAPKRVNDG